MPSEMLQTLPGYDPDVQKNRAEARQIIYEATFHLKQPQPALLALLASGYSPVYPCHVPPQDMRQHPIGTGPFKFVSVQAERGDPGDPQSG
jgi:ABC-type transport system substrate-binding protein